LNGDWGVVAAEVLRQEGIEKRVAHSDKCPDKPEEYGGHGEVAAIEERLDAVAGEFTQVALYDFEGRELLVDDLRVAADLVENVFGEPGLALVEVGDSVDDRDGFSLPAAGEEEFGRLEQVEKEEAADEHEEGDASDDVDEVTPALVGRKVDDASPGDCDVSVRLQSFCIWYWIRTERCDQLANWPPYREQGQETTVGHWKKFEEEGTINGQVSTDSETNTGEEGARSDPVGCSSGGDTEDTSNAKCAVESQSAAYDIRHDAPERGTDTETEEEREGGVTDRVGINAVLLGH